MGQAAPSAPLARRSPIAQKCPPLADFDRLLYNCWANTPWERMIKNQLQRDHWRANYPAGGGFSKWYESWASCTMAPTIVNVLEAAQPCREQPPSDEVLSQGFQFRSACGSQASCFTALCVGTEKSYFSELSYELQNAIFWLTNFHTAKSSLDFCLQAVAWHIPDDYFRRRQIMP